MIIIMIAEGVEPAGGLAFAGGEKNIYIYIYIHIHIYIYIYTYGYIIVITIITITIMKS